MAFALSMRHGRAMQMVKAYEALKVDLVQASGLTNPELHLHFGMMIFLATALVLRKPLWSPIPLLAVIAMEAGNEALDRFASGSWRWPDTRMDILFTLLWPAAIFAASHILKRVRR